MNMQKAGTVHLQHTGLATASCLELMDAALLEMGAGIKGVPVGTSDFRVRVFGSPSRSVGHRVAADTHTQRGVGEDEHEGELWFSRTRFFFLFLACSLSFDSGSWFLGYVQTPSLSYSAKQEKSVAPKEATFAAVFLLKLKDKQTPVASIRAIGSRRPCHGTGRYAT